MRESQSKSVLMALQDGWDWLSASDPGLNRLRLAVRGAVAMGSALAVEWLLAGQALGKSGQERLIAMLLGAVVAMMGSMGLSAGAVTERAMTAAMFPASIGVGMVVGMAVASNTDLLLCVFVVVLFVAVYVRRFGQPFFFAGFMVWMGYFFASFLGASFGQLPWLILYTAVAAVWVLALSLTVLRENTTRTLRHTLGAFTVRAEGVAEAAADLLDERRHAGRQLQRRQRRLNETALMVEGQLADEAALPQGWSAPELRRWLSDAELALDEITFAASQLAREGAGVARSAATTALRRVSSGDTAAARAAAGRIAACSADVTGNAAHARRRLADAIHDYVNSTAQWAQPPRHRDDQSPRPEQEFAPSVTMMMGRLPNSNAIASNIAPRSASWNPLARLPMTTRQAIQVALAGGLAILAGRALSEQRYYWAVIAAFIAFTGTATRGETFVKAVNRVVGTAAGLAGAIALANLTAGHTNAVLAVILGSMFLGFYLQPISYAFMIFFVTIMVAQLYSVLHEFSDGLLFLRLEETAIGAGIGIMIALVVLPVSTTETSRAARRNFYTGLQELLEATAERLATGTTEKDLDGLARTVNTHLYQLRQILQPLTTPFALRGDATRIRHRLILYTATSTAARAVASAARTARADPALAEASRHLAAAAETLASQDNADASVDRALNAARECLDTAADRAAQPTGEPGSQPLDRALTRLELTLQHLTDGSAERPSKRDPRRQPATVPSGR